MGLVMVYQNGTSYLVLAVGCWPGPEAATEPLHGSPPWVMRIISQYTVRTQFHSPTHGKYGNEKNQGWYGNLLSKPRAPRASPRFLSATMCDPKQTCEIPSHLGVSSKFLIRKMHCSLPHPTFGSPPMWDKELIHQIPQGPLGKVSVILISVGYSIHRPDFMIFYVWLKLLAKYPQFLALHGLLPCSRG